MNLDELVTKHSRDQISPQETQILKGELASVGLYPPNYIGSEESVLLNEAVDIYSDINYGHYVLDNLSDQLRNGDQTMGVDDKYLLQISLNKLGYKSGAVDGVIGRTSMEALDAYRADFIIAPSEKQGLDKLIAGLKEGIVVEGNQVTVNARIARQVIDVGIDHYLENGDIGELSPDAVVKLKEGLLKDFQSNAITFAGLDVQPREQSFATNSSSFVMVSPEEHATSLKSGIKTRAIWESVRDALEDTGAKVQVIDGSLTAGRSIEVYVRDIAFVLEDTVYLPDKEFIETAQFTSRGGDQKIDNDSYLQELNQIRKFYEEQGYKIVDVKGAWFEGGNIIPIKNGTGNTLFTGIANDEMVEFSEVLLKSINETQPEKWKMVGVPLVQYDPFYHLDLGMSNQLPNGEVILYRGVTDQDTYTRIVESVGVENVIEVDAETANSYSINLNFSGNTIILSGDSPELREQLEERGYKVVTPSDYGLDTFEFGQGGVHCITNEIPENAPSFTP